MALTPLRRRRGTSGRATGAVRLALWLLLAACPATVTAREQRDAREPASCPPHDMQGRVRFLAHPRDCSMFLRCHAGREVPGRCPPGTAFLARRGVCGDPARSSCAACAPSGRCQYRCSCAARRGQAACPARAELSVQLHVSEPGCHRDEGTFTLLGNKLGRVELLPSPSTFSLKTCPEGPGRSSVPHFGDCRRVYLCEGGREVRSECPDGYLFRAETGFCEEPDFVNCSSADNSSSSPERGCPPEAVVQACRYSCDCPLSGGQGTCPPRLQLDFHVSIFDSARHPDCLQVSGVTALGEQYVGVGSVVPNSTEGLYCPAGGTSRPVYLPHPTDCESFIMCWRGTQSVRPCPAGRQYDPATQRCGEPDVSLCLHRRSPPTALMAQQALQCPTSWVCSSAYRGVPHISDCTLFCRCDGSQPVLAACAPGTHFSARTQTCEDPTIAKCRPTCAQLGKLNGSGGEDRGIWQPRSCIEGDSKLGAKCHLKCYPNYALDGSVMVRCTRQGWASNRVLNIIPACRTPEEIGSNLVSKINESLSVLGNMRTELLFIIDEANRVSTQQFAVQKNLIASIIRVFPLSEQRLAGVATLSSDARVYIRLIAVSTCDFLNELRYVGSDPANGGATKRPPDITQTLEAVEAEIDRRGLSSRALVFLITSKRTRTKPLAAAEELKKSRNFLFTIGVGKFNRKQMNLASSRHRDGSKLFFGLPSVKTTKRMIAQVTREYGSEEANYCF